MQTTRLIISRRTNFKFIYTHRFLWFSACLDKRHVFPIFDRNSLCDALTMWLMGGEPHSVSQECVPGLQVSVKFNNILKVQSSDCGPAINT